MDDQRLDDPAGTLTAVRRLQARSRQRAHGGAWAPAAILVTLVLLSTILYRYPFGDPPAFSVAYPFWAGLPDPQRAPLASYLFWLVGLPAAFAAIAAWYRHRARRLGVRVPWPVLVTVGLGTLVLLLALVAVPRQPMANPDTLTALPLPWWYGLVTPLLAVAAAVIALGGVERRPTLAVAGAWLGLLAWWQAAAGRLGDIPRWVIWLLDGGSGPALGGQLALPAAATLAVMTAPLLAWVLVEAVRTRGGSR
ncbi:MAG: hypothetical protein QOI74_187 [Micromonosporaceae bacterium]|jgi:hypothetical protein|nr:hypothetical protein [Micromonosporaceae bacterium]